MQQVKAVVALAKGEPVQLTTINVPDPGPGEAVVKVQACGVCHTDLHYREGGINDDFPFLLGHEAAGVVEAVGPDVTGLEPGDFVVLNWRAVCGNCRACNRGEPWYCFATHNATQKMTLAEGTGRHRAVARARHRRLRREDAGRRRPVHEGRPVGPCGRRRPARLRRDGRPRCRHQHRQRRPRLHRRRHRLRRRRRGRDRRRGTGRGGEDHRRRPRRPEARAGAQDGRHPHGELLGGRPGRGDPVADAAAGRHRPRGRRRRRDRRRRTPGDVEAGVLRPRPGRHRRAGRRARRRT